MRQRTERWNVRTGVTTWSTVRDYLSQRMKVTYPAIASTVAAVLAGAALTVSLTHSGPQGMTGPRGIQGPQGVTGKNAQIAHLGLCWDLPNEIAAGTSDNYQEGITAPVLTDGVPSCPIGSFVSIVPGG